MKQVLQLPEWPEQFASDPFSFSCKSRYLGCYTAISEPRVLAIGFLGKFTWHALCVIVWAALGTGDVSEKNACDIACCQCSMGTRIPAHGGTNLQKTCSKHCQLVPHCCFLTLIIRAKTQQHLWLKNVASTSWFSDWHSGFCCTCPKGKLQACLACPNEENTCPYWKQVYLPRAWIGTDTDTCLKLQANLSILVDNYCYAVQ